MKDSVLLTRPTSFDIDLLKELEATDFHLLHPDYYFSFLEQHLPIVGSRAVGGELLCVKEPILTATSWLEIIRSTLSRWVGHDSSQELAVIVGDNNLNRAYALPFGQFVEHAGDFFSIPQDTYVILQHRKLCFQYTYYDELFLYQLQ